MMPVPHIFEDLMESVQQMDEIRRGERQPSREFAVDDLQLLEVISRAR